MTPLTAQQAHGARFLASRAAAYLADEPGFGKTAQTIRALDFVRPPSAVVLVPNQTLALNWQREIERWSLVGHDTTIIKSAKQDVPSAGVALVTYALASRKPVLKKLMARAKPWVLISDEAHALKEPKAQRTKAVLNQVGLAAQASHVWLLSGTPAPNHSGELYVFSKLCGAWAGPKSGFENQFCVLERSAFGERIVGSKNHQQLKDLIAPYFLRRCGVEDRPPLRITTQVVEAPRDTDPFAGLSPEELVAIEAAIASSDWRLLTTPAIATARRLLGMAKVDGVAEIAATDLEGGYSKLLIFAHHTAVIDALAERLKKFEPMIIDGRTPPKRQAEIEMAFQNGAPRVLIGQTQAAGEGRTLTAADRVLLAEPSWTPKDNEQMIARAWRRTQTKPVHASYIELANSLDERITRALKRKSHDIARLI